MKILLPLIIFFSLPRLCFGLTELEQQQMRDFLDLKLRSYKEIGIPSTFEGEQRYRLMIPFLFKESSRLGFENISEASVHDILRSSEKIIFHKVYTLDSLSRRKGYACQGECEFLSFLGCSYTFGEGLADHETLAYLAGEKFGDTQTFNYGIIGAGLNTALRQAQVYEFQDELAIKKGAFVYVYIDDHIPRSIGNLPTLTWTKATPYFEPSTLETHGPIQESRKLRTSILLTLYEYFPFLFGDHVFPPLTESHYNYACRMMVKMSEVLQQKINNSQFLVYFHPYSGGESYAYLQECLAKHGVSSLRSKIDISKNSDYLIKDEGHPSSQLNGVIVKELQAYFEK